MEIIKAVKVNEFEKGDNYDFTARVSVKVKNKIFEMKIFKCTYGDNKGKTETTIAESITKTFSDLDIEVDYSDIIKEYETMLEDWKVEKEKTKTIKAKEEYKKSWIHKAKKEMIALKSGVSISIITEKDYIENKLNMNHNIKAMTINYNGIDTEVQYMDVSYNHNFKYTINDRDLTNYKRRGYKKLSSLLNKFKELVNEYIIKNDNKKKATIEKNNLKETLEQIKIENCKVEVESDSYYYALGGNKREWRDNGYKLAISWNGGTDKDGGSFISKSYDGIKFSIPVLNIKVDLETLKRYIAHIKSFDLEG